jgi:hypothetical protein
MSQPIFYVDTSTIREGKLEELEVAMKHLAVFVEENVPQLISYGFYLDGERTEMTVVAVHPDSASLALHMDAGGAEFKKFANLIELSRIEVYGRVSKTVLERLQQKARMLGSGVVVVHEFYAGFAR